MLTQRNASNRQEACTVLSDGACRTAGTHLIAMAVFRIFSLARSSKSLRLMVKLSPCRGASDVGAGLGAERSIKTLEDHAKKINRGLRNRGLFQNVSVDCTLYHRMHAESPFQHINFRYTALAPRKLTTPQQRKTQIFQGCVRFAAVIIIDRVFCLGFSDFPAFFIKEDIQAFLLVCSLFNFLIYLRNISTFSSLSCLFFQGNEENQDKRA